MAAKNCKVILLQAAIKDLWTSANLKLKKSTLSKLTSLGLYYCIWFKALLHSEFSEKRLTLKVRKTIKGMKIIW